MWRSTTPDGLTALLTVVSNRELALRGCEGFHEVGALLLPNLKRFRNWSIGRGFVV